MRGGPNDTRTPSPGQLDLQLALLALDLQLDLEFDLVGHGHGERHAAALELDVVVAGEHVGQIAQPVRNLLAAQRLLLLYLEDVHQLSFVVARRASARTPWVKVSGSAAEGDAPGCCRAMRTLSTPGRMANRSGGSSRPPPPSIPARTPWSASTSKPGARPSPPGPRGPCPPPPPPP